MEQPCSGSTRAWIRGRSSAISPTSETSASSPISSFNIAWSSITSMNSATRASQGPGPPRRRGRPKARAGATVAQRVAPVETASRRLVIALLYHDVVAPGAASSSGFRGGDAGSAEVRRQTLRATSSLVATRGVEVEFTFDDGGVGAIENAAACSSGIRMRGIFFAYTDYAVGPRGFSMRLRSGNSMPGHRRLIISVPSCPHVGVRRQQLFDGASLCSSRDDCGSACGRGLGAWRVLLRASGIGCRACGNPPAVYLGADALPAVGGQVRGCRTFLHPAGHLSRSGRGMRPAGAAFRICLTQDGRLQKAIKAVGGDSWLRLRRWWLRRAD